MISIEFTSSSLVIECVEITTQNAFVKISLYGGQILEWSPKSQLHPVLWMSNLENHEPGKAIRGGVPICWPNFGEPAEAGLPSHGYARLSQWEIEKIYSKQNSEVSLTLVMTKPGVQYGEWTEALKLREDITIGEALTIEIATTNTGIEPVKITEGLRTYIMIGDISNISINGLEGDGYYDLLEKRKKRNLNPIRIDKEFGRIYLDSAATCLIVDAELRRKIKVVKEGSKSTAVWNPWELTSSKMKDLGPTEWRRMVCVESANALDNAVEITGGNSHVLKVEYSVVNY